MYKKLIIILVFLTGVFTNFYAQNKKIEKVKKYYTEGEYQKCINKSEKYSKKNSKTAEFYLFKSLSYYQITKTTSNNEHENLKISKKIISETRKAFKYQKSENQFDEYKIYIDSIHTYLIKTADNLFEDKRSYSKYYYDNLAKIFKDTCENYYVFHPNEKVSEKEKEIIPDFSESLEGKRKEMLNVAKSLVGTKYVWAGEDPKGFDCSGYTMYLYKQIGYKLPHNAQLQSKIGITVPLEEAKPGDLIFFGYKTGTTYHAVHAGVIYANNNGVIDLTHCVSGGVNIHLSDNSNNKYWLKRVLFVKRIIGEESCNQLLTNK